MRFLKYEQSGKRENGSGHNYSGTGPYRLNDNVLSKGILFFKSPRQSYGNNGYRYGRFKYLAYAQTKVGCCCTENNGKQQPHANRVGRYFLVVVSRMHHGPVFFVGRQLAECVFGQSGDTGVVNCLFSSFCFVFCHCNNINRVINYLLN